MPTDCPNAPLGLPICTLKLPGPGVAAPTIEKLNVCDCPGATVPLSATLDFGSVIRPVRLMRSRYPGLLHVVDPVLRAVTRTMFDSKTSTYASASSRLCCVGFEVVRG